MEMMVKNSLVGALYVFSNFNWVGVAGWPPVGGVAARSACGMFHGVSA